MHPLTKLIRNDMKPALGVTEPGAIAYAAATARRHTEGAIRQVALRLNSGMYKNAFTCGIPGTERTGNLYAAALGAVGADPAKGLECLDGITEDQAGEAQALVEAGKVTVDGRKAELGTLVESGMKVKVNGETVGTAEDVSSRKTVLIAVNKPRGVVCTTSDKDRAPNIVEMVEYPERIYPIGRLDKDSEGLMLMTNQGDLVDQILRGSNGHEKEYLVRVDKALTEKFVEHMRRGVHLGELQVTTRPCKVVINDKTSFYITLTQGLNRQIRRMCEALDYHVISLKRIRVMNIRLGNLKTGTWRNVSPEELKTLRSMLKKDAKG